MAEATDGASEPHGTAAYKVSPESQLTPIEDVRTRCKSPVKMFFAPEGDPFDAATLCKCGHPRRDHNFLWNACRGCATPKEKP